MALANQGGRVDVGDTAILRCQNGHDFADPYISDRQSEIGNVREGRPPVSASRVLAHILVAALHIDLVEEPLANGLSLAAIR